MVEVEGARQLRATLKKAGIDLGQLKEANAAAARMAAAASAALAPRRTGRLQATIRASGTNTAGIIRAGTKRAPYAQAVHWGRIYWPNRKGGSAGRRRKSAMDGQPFLSEGARDSEGQWLPVYQTNVYKIIEQVKGK